jgi:hypothetical protein
MDEKIPGYHHCPLSPCTKIFTFISSTQPSLPRIKRFHFTLLSPSSLFFLHFSLLSPSSLSPRIAQALVLLGSIFSNQRRWGSQWPHRPSFSVHFPISFFSFLSLLLLFLLHRGGGGLRRDACWWLMARLCSDPCTMTPRLMMRLCSHRRPRRGIGISRRQCRPRRGSGRSRRWRQP